MTRATIGKLILGGVAVYLLTRSSAPAAAAPTPRPTSSRSPHTAAPGNVLGSISDLLSRTASSIGGALRSIAPSSSEPGTWSIFDGDDET